MFPHLPLSSVQLISTGALPSDEGVVFNPAVNDQIIEYLADTSAAEIPVAENIVSSNSSRRCKSVYLQRTLRRVSY